MHVIATAGHVDHGKSTLVRALTGMEPDRWAEEQRRGMTIDLGFAWTRLEPARPASPTVAFVDVPGHERFVPNMIAGVGPAPAAMLVVSADGGWMPQSAEHVEALDALGVSHGLLVITRSDLMEPELALEDARDHLARTSLEHVAAVCVSAVTGDGMAELRTALAALVATLPPPEVRADVRLWIDRAFTIRGAGSVVTGTLTAGTLRVGDTLELASTGETVTVRALQALGAPEDRVAAVARVAVNLRGVSLEQLHRGDALLTPGRFRGASTLDVRWRTAGEARKLPTHAVLHVGSAAVQASVRPLGQDTARLTLDSPLPVRIGDRGVLRDPGARRVSAGITVLDPMTAPLRRRGAAAVRAGVLSELDGVPDGAAELARREVVRYSELLAMGATPPGTAARRGDWLVDRDAVGRLAAQLAEVVARHHAEHPLDDGLPLEAARRAVGLPDARLLEPLLADPAGASVLVRDGRAHHRDHVVALPPAVRDALAALQAQLHHAPFAAPEAHQLTGLGLGPKQLALLVRGEELLRVGDGIYLLPDGLTRARAMLAGLDTWFTLSEARQALGTTRRVAVPLMEHLARARITVRDDEGHHRLA